MKGAACSITYTRRSPDPAHHHRRPHLLNPCRRSEALLAGGASGGGAGGGGGGGRPAGPTSVGAIGPGLDDELVVAPTAIDSCQGVGPACNEALQRAIEQDEHPRLMHERAGALVLGAHPPPPSTAGGQGLFPSGREERGGKEGGGGHL